MDDTPSICSDCARNRHLRILIARNGSPMFCRLCQRTQPEVFTLDQLADTLSKAIRDNFGRPHQWNGILRGDSLETIVAEMLTQNVDYLNYLVETIVDREDYDQRDGDKAFFDADDVYQPVRHRVSAESLDRRWREIVVDLKHKRRFFSASVQAFFAELFADLDTYKTWNVDQRSHDDVVHTLPPGMLIYRARAIDPGDARAAFADPFKEVGPPPRHRARSMRMSPEGVVALYAAMHKETAIAELRPAIGGTVAVVELRLTKPLRVLNFERLERALDAEWSELLHPDPQAARETRKFLRKLHRLIAAPVVPGHEDEYLITQSMAEYLAYEHPLQLDGILFKSVQDADGTNLVMFPDKESADGVDRFAVNYAPHSLSFHRVQQVAYTAEALRFERDGLGDYSLYTEASLREREVAWHEMEWEDE